MNEIFLTCENCGEADETVEKTIDPYVLEIYGEEEQVALCSECYDQRRDDI